MNNPTDYKYRIECVNSILPKEQDLTNWRTQFEYNEQEIYGNAYDKWPRGIIDDTSTTALTALLSKSNLDFFQVCHFSSELINTVKVWPNSTIIALTNYYKFHSIAYSIKSSFRDKDFTFGNYCQEKYSLLKGFDWPNWEEFDEFGYDITKITNYKDIYSKEIINEISKFYPSYPSSNKVIFFDIDNNIFSKDEFLKAMEKLYKQLQYSDFNSDLIYSYWCNYIGLHNTTDEN